MALVCGSAWARPAAARQAPARREAFPIRGIKGLWWQGFDNYRLALPWLAQHHLNFLMFCYTSFPASATDWRSDYSAEELRGFREMAGQAKRLGVRLCLSFNPGIWSKPPLVHAREADFQAALRKVRAVHSLGIDWFALCLDDINRELQPEDRQRFGTLQAAQVYFVNRLWREIRALRPRPHLIFCPSAYTTEDARTHQDYIRAIGEGINREVGLFWTGPVVCSPRITAADARAFGEWIRRKPFVWDNYPVNDMFPWRPLLAPLRGRSADLGGAVSGYLANPMKQWHASRIPLTATALYLNDPAGYSAERGRASILKDTPPRQRAAIRLLLDLYGSSFLGEAGYPPRPQAADLKTARRLLARHRRLREVLSGSRELRDLWRDIQPTLEEDITSLVRRERVLCGGPLLELQGEDLSGGAAELYGGSFFGRSVNYVYAHATGRNEMDGQFRLHAAPSGEAALRLTARNDDSGRGLRIRVSLNDHVLLEGPSPFDSQDFRTVSFPIPTGVLRPGLNRLAILNLEESGPLGMPPWFMVAAAELKLP